MWKFWCLEEGTLGVDPHMHRTNDGRFPPVLHVDTDAPLYSDRDRKLITDKIWGIYYKPDFNFGGVQGGASPYKVEQDPDQVAVDPYGPSRLSSSSARTSSKCGARRSPIARSVSKARCRSTSATRIPGARLLHPDNFPVFDRFRENVYVIADSNHGYKMIGVGKLVAQELVGETSRLLEPFRFARCQGELHPTSHSPFPWS